ncbi:sodium/solute symporter [Chitinophaga sp. XS-30]|uniref:sodium:solute symporter family transporter n=1 Tax=Chitinophaga sp. XS-30 TaxID=2604421 RepID=UPI0011DCAAE9|nr:sodium/solute symporter [Chitinophaga sp. XS-30]QEH41787.1 sodium/solute symporter [Chitinophaga sp. XS-30]
MTLSPYKPINLQSIKTTGEYLLSGPGFKFICGLLIFSLKFSFFSVAQEVSSHVEWRKLGYLPQNNSAHKSAGVAAHFSGIHNDVLIMAGGTNFLSGGNPWDGGIKKWHDEIYVLEKAGKEYQWLNAKLKLPVALAYGASVSTNRGLLCIGGTDSISYKANTFLLKWNKDKQAVEYEALPDMPVRLAYTAAVIMNGSIYVAGGQEQPNGEPARYFLRLDLNNYGKQTLKWEQLELLPGVGRTMPVLAVQHNGTNDCIYLFSGKGKVNNSEVLLHDAYTYNPKTLKWRKLRDIQLKGQRLRCLTGAASISVGLNHILVFGGADSEGHRVFRKTLADFNAAKDPGKKEAYRDKLNEISNTHEGFSRDVLAYHTLTDKWTKVGEFSASLPVLTQASNWNGNIVFPGGEIAPAKRSAEIWQARMISKESSVLDGWDYLLIGAYFLAIFYIGYKYKKNINTTNDYYKAGNRIPGWASGVAIFGTLLSAITFLTTPAKTYNESWLYFLPTISSLVVAPFVVLFIIPVYFKLDVTTAYEYLEKRFSSLIRIIGSLSFLFFQVAKFGVMLLLPSLAIAAITGIDVMTCILVIGLFSTVYGTLGGIEAVVWTEVLQVFVFLLAAVLSILVVVLKLDGGLGEIITINNNFDKFEFINWDFSFSEITVFVAITYWIGGGSVPYISDQTVIQKYLVTKDIKSATRGVWINGILILVSSVLFFAIGSALFAYYYSFPEALNPTLPTQESIYPWFIVNELPSGVRGVVVAGIFAVAMSTISSTMNSMSATVVTDYVRFYKLLPKRQLFMAKGVSAAFGVIGTLLAVIMFVYEVGSLWDMIRRLTGLLTGGLAGLFLLGIFTKRVKHTAALIGYIASAIILFYVSKYTAAHFMVYSLTGMLSCFIAGYIASFLVDGKHNSKEIEQV